MPEVGLVKFKIRVPAGGPLAAELSGLLARMNSLYHVLAAVDV